MKPTFKRCTAVALLALFTPGLLAQENIAISDADISRMGIVFESVQAIDNNAGARFPATVINSPDSVATLSARYPGVVAQWLQASGSAVAAGETLAIIRSPEVLGVQNDWIAAVSERERAEFELRKDQELFDQGIISRQRLVQTRNRSEQVTFAEKSARGKLGLAGFDDELLNALRQDGTGLGHYLLASPVSAVLTQRVANVGSYVEANMPIAYLNSGERRWASIHVPGRFGNDMAIGQVLTVVDSDETLTLRQKDYVIDSSNQTIELFAEFDNESSFTTGQVISVVLPPTRQGVLVPERAVVHSGTITTVYVRSPSGVQARELNLTAVGAQYLAESGLRVGERVAIQGSAVLKGIQLGLGSSQ